MKANRVLCIVLALCMMLMSTDLTVLACEPTDVQVEESAEETVSQDSIEESVDSDFDLMQEDFQNKIENELQTEATGGVKQKLDSVLVSYPVGSTWNGSWGGATQCFGFARMIFSKVYGCEMPSAYKGSYRYIYSTNTNVTLVGRLEGNNVTASNVKSLFANARVGDIIQGCGGTYGQHTMILYSVTSTGITYYDCNSGGTNQIKYGTRTWSSMASRYSGYSSSYGNNGISIYRANNYDTVDFGSSSDSDLITLWGINNGDSYNGMVQLWAKRFNNDNNHYAVFYVDGQAVTGHLSADQSGYFSFWLDTSQYSNGNHTLKVEYAFTQGSGKSERTININNSFDFYNMSGAAPVGGIQTVRVKSVGYTQPAKLYIDDNYLATASPDANGIYTFYLDTTVHSQSMHRINAKLNINGREVVATIYLQFSQDYIQHIDNPSNGAKYNKGDDMYVSGWINSPNTSFTGNFYIDNKCIKTINNSNLFHRSDIGYTGGYSFSYGTGGLSVGTHTLKLETITNNRKAYAYSTFEVIGNTSNSSGGKDESGNTTNNNQNITDNQNDSDNVTNKNPNNATTTTTQVENFVSRMYTVALNREAEAAGLNDWSSQLAEQKIDGAGIANGFINSAEFTNQNLGNREFLDTLYETFFNRAADAGGKAYWMQQLSNGMSRTEVLSGFVNSQEFSNLCDNYGIARGTMQPNGTSIYRPGVRNYVLRMYTKALNRDGETVGVEDWTNRINTGTMNAENVAKSFFNSQEFINRNLSNSAYVETLYQTFMDRPSDASGKQYWIDKLNSGMSREQVLEGFSRSAEFSEIMARYGL